MEGDAHVPHILPWAEDSPLEPLTVIENGWPVRRRLELLDRIFREPALGAQRRPARALEDDCFGKFLRRDHLEQELAGSRRALKFCPHSELVKQPLWRPTVFVLVNRVRGNGRSRLPLDRNRFAADPPASDFDGVRRLHSEIFERDPRLDGTRIAKIAVIGHVEKHEFLLDRDPCLTFRFDTNQL